MIKYYKVYENILLEAKLVLRKVACTVHCTLLLSKCVHSVVFSVHYWNWFTQLPLEDHLHPHEHQITSCNHDVNTFRAGGIGNPL